MKNKQSGIYCIENKINHKKYIGQSNDVNNRWRHHVSELNNGNHHNDYLQKSWNKYGKDCFDFYVIEYCGIENLDEREIYWIDFYNTLSREFGYNLTGGGQLSKGCYDIEVRDKLSKAIKKSYDNDDLREKRSKDAILQWSNSEIREKHSGENNGMYGKHHSEETKQKIREQRNSRTRNVKQIRKVICVELNKIFNNASIAAKEMKISNSGNILKVCYGERQTCCGYHWEFVDINNMGII